MTGRQQTGPADPDTPIRVAVVDDHELVRAGIRNALSLAPDIALAGEAGDGLAALELLEHEPVDVVLLDLHMPRMDGFACLDAIRTRWPDMPVVVLTVDEDPEVVRDVMRRGATAYVPKFVRPADLAALVRQAAGGAVVMGGSRFVGALGDGGSTAAPQTPAYGLTDREVEVLGLVAQGKSNDDVARALFITTKTVKYHLTSIFQKLGVRNRTEAAAFAITHGLGTTPASGGARPPLS